MQLPSSRLPDTSRQAVRFTVVGTSGTLIQYGLYWAFLELCALLWPDYTLTRVAFSLGFLIEMCTNYFLNTWYTFSSRPSMKNAGGFLIGRAVNYVIQLVGLQIFLWLSCSEKLAGLLAIVVAGIINFFVLRPFFKTTA